MNASFGGDKNVGQSLSHTWEQAFIQWVVPRLPRWLTSYHLTLATLPICVLILVSCWLARTNINWLWAVSFLITLQWLTDSLDGSLGRQRGEGLVRWGYYMDHFLDYMFLLSYLIGYIFIFPEQDRHLQFFTLATLSAFMVNSFLAFGVSNEFRISYFNIGPTEIRLIFIVVNTIVILANPARVGWLLPYILAATFVGLGVVVYRTQRSLWEIDKRQVCSPSLKYASSCGALP